MVLVLCRDLQGDRLVYRNQRPDRPPHSIISCAGWVGWTCAGSASRSLAKARLFMLPPSARRGPTVSPVWLQFVTRRSTPFDHPASRHVYKNPPRVNLAVHPCCHGTLSEPPYIAFLIATSDTRTTRVLPRPPMTMMQCLAVILTRQLTHPVYRNTLTAKTSSR